MYFNNKIKKNMEKSEMLWIASKYGIKGYSHGQMRNGDECYHLNDEEGDKIKDKIAQYMEELQDIGRIAFYEKYKDYKLYHNGFELSSYNRKK